MQEYLIHVGYPKAASTWLQEVLFSGLDSRIQPLQSDPQIGKTKKPGGELFFNSYGSDEAENMRTYLYPFDFNAQSVRQKIENRIPKSGKYICLSNEAWVGHPYGGGISGRLMATRIQETIPKAKVIIVIRKQEDIILSAFADYLNRAGGICSLQRYLKPTYQDHVSTFSPYYYCYDLVAKFYRDAFGDNNVLILPFELLSTKGPEAFLGPIYGFLNIPPQEDIFLQTRPRNKGDYSSYAALRLCPLINIFAYPHPANGNAGLAIGTIRDALVSIFKLLITKKKQASIIENDRKIIAEFIGPFARKSNQKLQKHIQFDLKELGYTI